MKTIEFLGIRFDDCDMQQALDRVSRAAGGNRFAYVVTPNVDHAVMFGEAGTESWREAYRAAVRASDLCLNDSRILQRLSALSGDRLPITPGSDLVRRLVEHRRGATGKVVLVGGSPREADWLRGALPRHQILQHEPPMGVRDDPGLQAAIAEFVEQAGADITLFAIGAPQSEIVAHAIAGRGKARGVGLCIGASVEFLSGAKRRAPQWMQRAGLEWLFRLSSEPGRLWRRYLVRGPRVFGLWWAQKGRK